MRSIHRNTSILGAGLLGLALVSLCASALEVEHFFKPFARGDAKVLRVEVPVGELVFEPHGGRSLEVEMTLDCSGKLTPCRQRAETVKLDSKHEGEVQVLGFSGPESYEKPTRVWFSYNTFAWHTNAEGEKKIRTKSKSIATSGWKLSAALDIAHPEYEVLDVRLGEGTVVARQLQSGAHVEVGRGAVDLAISKAQVQSVTLEVGRKSSAVLMVPGERRQKGRSIQWTGGDGDAEVVVRVERGSVMVHVY